MAKSHIGLDAETMPPPENHPAKCPTCAQIWSALATPFHKSVWERLGEVGDLLASDCETHGEIIAYCTQRLDRNVGAYEMWMGKTIQTTHLHFELMLNTDHGIQDTRSSLENLELVTDGHEALISDRSPLAHTSIRDHEHDMPIPTHLPPGNGLILDPDWIDLDRIRDWYQICRQEHGQKCTNSSTTSDLPPDWSSSTALYLVDVHDCCVVRTRGHERYIALSYVWGGVPSLRTLKSNFQNLCQHGALEQPSVAETIPVTIRDAIALTRLLGERYLWVDSMCIIQDDFDTKQLQLNAMAAIYANAELTIVVAEYENASSGLRGVRELPKPLPRCLQQSVLSFGKRKLIDRTFSRAYIGEEKLSSPYHSRAWTFQEYLFSRRRLIFDRQSVAWGCNTCQCFEDLCCPQETKTTASSFSWAAGIPILNEPSLPRFGKLVSRFNSTKLTYEEDCLDAFAGILNTWRTYFEHGFICGLPEFLLDAALLWQPDGNISRRVPQTADSDVRQPSATSLPSWSWVGWSGPLDDLSWQNGCDFVKTGGDAYASRETFPVTTWWTGPAPQSSEWRVLERGWSVERERYRRQPLSEIPDGWQREAKTGNSFPPPPLGFGGQIYLHEDLPDMEFWYPIPMLNRAKNHPSRRPTNSSWPYLFANVERATLHTNGQMPDRLVCYVPLFNPNRKQIGILRPHHRSQFAFNTAVPSTEIELVALSIQLVSNVSIDEYGSYWWDNKECRHERGCRHEYYNVMWVRWADGVAYRQGLGCVVRNEWERLPRQRIDLVLG